MAENSESVIDVGDEESSFIDVDKLIAVVEAKPELYVIGRKDHHNHNTIAKAW